MSIGTIILIVIGSLIVLLLLGVFLFVFSVWKSIFVAREVLDTADTAMTWGKRAKWGRTWFQKKFQKKKTSHGENTPQKT